MNGIPMQVFGVWLGCLAWAMPVTAAVTAVPVTPTTQIRWLTLDGTVEPVHQGTVAAQTSGRISRMLVDVNDEVAAGTPLLEITGKEQSANVAAAEAQLARAIAQRTEADRQLARFQALTVKGAVSKAQLDNAQATALSAASQVTAAQAALAQAREAYGYTKVLAPYAGVVTARHVELGETVAPGTALLSGFSLDALRVVADLPQSAMTTTPLVAAQTQIVLDNGQLLQPVSVTRFNHADSATHTFRLRLELPAGTRAVMPGQWVKVRLQQGERQALLIPETALLRQGELSAVYLQRSAEPGKAAPGSAPRWALTPVLTGQPEPGTLPGQGRVEVLSGLQAGDQIASDAWAVMREVQHE